MTLPVDCARGASTALYYHKSYPSQSHSCVLLELIQGVSWLVSSFGMCHGHIKLISALEHLY